MGGLTKKQTKKALEKIGRKMYSTDFSMMDDIAFRAYLDNDPKLATFILRIVLNKKDIVVKKITAQKTISSLVGKSVILDALAVDSKNRVYNIEVQKVITKDIIYRSRAYMSLINVNNIDKGQDYSSLPETYVIFFCNFDIFKRKKQIYIFNKTSDDGFQLNDKEHVVYVNCKSNDTSTDIGKLIHDMKSKIGSKKCYNEFSKQDKKGGEKVSEFWDNVAKMFKEEGQEETYISVIVSMLKKGLDISLISNITNKSTTDILSIKEQYKL